MASTNAKAKSRVDLATILGLTIGLGGIVGGLMMEGGKLQDISQISAAVIVLEVRSEPSCSPIRFRL